MLSKIVKRQDIIIYSLCIMGLVIGGIWDYPIAQLLYRPHNILGCIFEDVIPLIFYILVGACFLILWKVKKAWYWFLGFFLTFGVLAFSPVFQKIGTAAGFIFSAGIVLIEAALIQRMKETMLLSFASLAEIYLKTLFISMLLVVVMKNIWGRVRYRDLTEYAQFRPWYLFSRMGGASFPSGHTCAAGSTLCFTALRIPRRRLERVIHICTALFVLIMIITRWTMGAHYISDTAAGLLISYSSFFVVRNKDIYYNEQ